MEPLLEAPLRVGPCWGESIEQVPMKLRNRAELAEAQAGARWPLSPVGQTREEDVRLARCCLWGS